MYRLTLLDLIYANETQKRKNIKMLNFLYQCYEKFPVLTSASVGVAAAGIVAMANPIGWVAAGVGMIVWGAVEEINRNLRDVSDDELMQNQYVVNDDYYLG